MKKLLSLVVVAGALCLSLGCEDKKTTAPAGGGKAPTPAGGSAPSAAPSKS